MDIDATELDLGKLNGDDEASKLSRFHVYDALPPRSRRP
jgi:hypothetical protein